MDFYKANKAITGCGAKFNYDSKRDGKNCVWLNLVKQKGWDQNGNRGNGVGKFFGGEQTSVKFSLGEIGILVRCINKVKPLTDYTYKNSPLYHKSKDRVNVINFGPYIKDGSYLGMTFSVTRQENGESEKHKFTMSLTPGEAEVLRIWLENAVCHIAEGIKSSDIKKAMDAKKNKDSSDDHEPSDSSDVPF